MERRTNPRRAVRASIICEPFSSLKSGTAIEGHIKNCCLAGFCAELKEHLQAGTVLMVRMGGKPASGSANERGGSMALAEVCWSKRVAVEKDARYGTGLRYLRAY
jgi:hypothetical protein